MVSGIHNLACYVKRVYCEGQQNTSARLMGYMEASEVRRSIHMDPVFICILFGLVLRYVLNFVLFFLSNSTLFLDACWF